MILDNLISSYRRAMFGKTGDGEDTYEVFRLDPATHATESIEYEHAAIHQGNSYEYASYRDQTVNHVWDIQLSTGSRNKVPHITFEFDAESETLWHFCENVNIILPGTAVTPPNHDRSSDNTSLLTVAYITNTNLGNANADTAVAGATILREGIAGSGKKVGGQGGARHEWILNRNEDYLLRFIATAAGWISWHFDWYELEPKGD